MADFMMSWINHTSTRIKNCWHCIAIIDYEAIGVIFKIIVVNSVFDFHYHNTQRV